MITTINLRLQKPLPVCPVELTLVSDDGNPVTEAQAIAEGFAVEPDDAVIILSVMKLYCVSMKSTLTTLGKMPTTAPG